MAVGAVGDRIRVAKAVADGSVEPRFMLGVAFEDIDNGTEGYLTLTGDVKGLDTNSYTIGDVLYISPTTPGTFTTTEPTSPQLTMPIAIVTKVNSSSGHIFVRMWSQQAGIHELHDVLVTGPANHESLVYNSASSVWVNRETVSYQASAPSDPMEGDVWVDSDAIAGVLNQNDYLLKADFELVSIPVGGVTQYAGATSPSVNYAICDGAAVNRTTYATLFARIGTTYGIGDGSTTFNLPNVKGRVIAGRDSAQTEFDTLAETGGAKTHTLTTAEMPVHNHNEAYTYYQPNFSNATVGDQNPVASAPGGESGSVSRTSDNTGSGGAHNNLQPYIVMNYLIRIL
jgi:microcystin-dependent protein